MVLATSAVEIENRKFRFLSVRKQQFAHDDHVM